MIRMLPYLCSFALAMTACTNTTTTSTANTTETTSSQPDSLVSVPDAADLLQTLQGKWQSESDSTYVVEIVGNKMKHYNNGLASVDSEIEIDASCGSNACKVDSTDLTDGWCFVEKGQFDAQCNLVLKCDQQALQYRAIGAASGTLRFSKK